MLRQDGGWPCFSSSSSMDSSLISAPRRDSLLLEITSFQRQPRISFRKFIDRRNISSEEETMYIHAFIVYGDAGWSHVYRFQLRLSRKFRIRNAFKRDADSRWDLKAVTKRMPRFVYLERDIHYRWGSVDRRSMRFTRQLRSIRSSGFRAGRSGTRSKRWFSLRHREKETPSASQGSVKSCDHPLTATLKLYR